MLPRLATLLALALLPLPAAGTSAIGPSVIEAAGNALASSPLCGIPEEPAAAHLTATRQAPGLPWVVRFEAAGAPCPAFSVVTCWGSGSLADGVPVSCDDGSEGVFGPAWVCTPGPMSPPPANAALVHFDLGGQLGRFWGTIPGAITGPAVGEANPLCL